MSETKPALRFSIPSVCVGPYAVKLKSSSVEIEFTAPNATSAIIAVPTAPPITQLRYF